MEIIEEKSDFILKIWPNQPICTNKTYRKLKYIREIETKYGYLLFNLIIGEMVLLDSNEKEKFFNPVDLTDEFTLYLIKNWYLVPFDNDDLAISKKLISICKSINSVYTAPKIKTFTILPTTDCNAHCFYCYEHGCEKKFMSKKTAQDVVSYIMKNKSDGYITLRWFGGEPLYNFKVIDYICDKLNDFHVNFVSKMISNAYLFDEDMIIRAKDRWKLNKIQITIDGTEDIYNRTKAYIYKNSESPFKKVLNNAENLIKNNIEVHFRLNMDIHNTDDLFKLSDYLLQKFKKYDNCYIYPHLLYDYANRPIGNRDEYYLNRKFLDLKAKLNVKTIKINPNAHTLRLCTHCMADTDTSIMILPDGKLGKCEHFLDEKFIGNIYDNKVDIQLLNDFKTMDVPLPKCDACEVRPACVHPVCCPSRKRICSDIDKKTFIKNLDNHIFNVFRSKVGFKNET